MLWHKTQGAGFGAAVAPAIEDVFSTYLYTGTGAAQTITNGIDLAGEGGMTWIKVRSTTDDHILYDTERGAYNGLRPNRTDGTYNISPNGLTSFNSDGFSLNGAITNFNASGQTYASWTFRKAPRFFDVVTYTGDGVAGRTVSHNLGTDVGTLIVKKTSGVDNWFVWHRNLTDATYRIILNLTSGEQQQTNAWNSTAPTSTEFTLGDNANVNESGATYVAYLFAHDPLGPSGDGSDGLIACGSFTTDGNGQATVDLGWEPQWVMVKNTAVTSSGSAVSWNITDNMRGMPVGSVDPRLFANTSDSENTSYDWISPTATGFVITPNAASGDTYANSNYIYIAIRRGPMREPTVGTEVFGMDDYTGGGAGPVTGFVTDMAILGQRAGGDKFYISSRLTGDKYMKSSSTSSELTQGNQKWDRMDGAWTSAVTNYMLWGFARAPGFFDVVAYSGDSVSNRAVPHNLGVAPEMMIVKCRSAGFDWIVWHDGLSGNTYDLVLNTTAAEANFDLFSSTAPDASNFYLGTNYFDYHNASTRTYIAYLFATLPGVSKVGSYTGNGSNQTINCGFTSGARFVLIKRTDSTGDWYVWDTARGIVSGNDPHLSLNTTAAEVTTDDSIDPDSSGFIVNEVAATNINVSSASYIFYAVS